MRPTAIVLGISILTFAIIFYFFTQQSSPSDVVVIASSSSSPSATKITNTDDETEQQQHQQSHLRAITSSEETASAPNNNNIIPSVPKSLVNKVVDRCNADLHNNPNKHISCVLLKNAAVFPDGSVQYSQEDNNNNIEINKRYPPVGKTRYFLRESKLIPVAKENLEKITQKSKTTNVGIFQHPVSGAAFDNVWHTLSDFAFILFDTILPFIQFAEESVEKRTGFNLRKTLEQKNSGDTNNINAAHHSQNVNNFEELRAPITWILFPPAWSNTRDINPCKTESVCRSKVLFEVFTKFFSRILFVDPSNTNQHQPIIRYEFLIVGMATSCSPVPTEGVGTQRCKTSLRGMRDHLLLQYGFNPFKEAFPLMNNGAPPPCRTIHLMSRQKGKYRRMHPFETIVSNLQNSVGNACGKTTGTEEASSLVKAISLSKSMTFKQQLQTIVNVDFLIAGRGGGTGLSIFLPLGAVYISVSGSDRWNPYRDLIPPWLDMIHYEAKLVDPVNEKLRCKPTKKGYVDANKCDYFLKSPEELSQIVDRALNERKK